MNYWITISIDAASQWNAEAEASFYTTALGGRIVDVQPEPPQGATVVGPMHEDEL